jgi:hypothetical protein
MLKITHDLDKLQKHIEQLKKQIPFATAKTLTTIGKRVKSELSHELVNVFNRPTSYITNSPFSTVATKAKPETTVGIRDQASRGASPAQYVKEEFGGGLRNQKPFEVVLSSMGALPSGWKAIPAAGLKLDANGNPNRTQLREIIGALKSGVGISAGRGNRQAIHTYFVIKPGTPMSARLNLGVWRRIKKGTFSVITPVMLFVPSASYDQSFNLPDLAQRIVSRDFNREFGKELQNALATAK